MSVSRYPELQRIDQEVQECIRCLLSRTRTKSVPGEGSASAQVVFVGEAPGEKEDIEGRLFVGKAGRLLSELLTSIKLDRETVYITNIVKCRPTTRGLSERGAVEWIGDRKPTNEEIAAGVPYLETQIRIIQPKIICTLGDTATQFILEKYGLKPRNISKVHGRIYSADDIKIVPMYHPAAALYTARLKAVLEKDIRKIAGLLEQTTLV